MQQDQFEKWRDLLAIFGTISLAPIDREELNSDNAGNRRLLLGLFFLGAVDFLHQAEGLTNGEFRHLYLEVMTTLEWPREAASTIFDIAGSLSKVAPELAEYGEEAVVEGANAFRDWVVGDPELKPGAAVHAWYMFSRRWNEIE